MAAICENSKAARQSPQPENDSEPEEEHVRASWLDMDILVIRSAEIRCDAFLGPVSSLGKPEISGI